MFVSNDGCFSCESVITRLKGNQVTVEYLAKNGFTKPILITNRDGLDLTLPNRRITLTEIGDLVGERIPRGFQCSIGLILSRTRSFYRYYRL